MDKDHSGFDERIPAGSLVDRVGRVIDHLRLSVTSACNLHCLYCRPNATNVCGTHDLTDSQRLELVRFMHETYGLRQLRLTGGEPLLHKTIVPLIEAVRAAMPDLSVAMTTNAWRLAPLAKSLREAGLDRLNISLDSIDALTYRRLTGGELKPVLEGIDASLDAGFPPPRLNAVVLAGINDLQLPEMASWALERGMELRFLEAMPIGPAADFNRKHFVPARGVLKNLESSFQLRLLPRRRGETAARYAVNGGAFCGTIGIVAPVTDSFCEQCRRVRVTANGRLYPCLVDGRCVNLRPAWHDSKLDLHSLDVLFRNAVGAKEARGAMAQKTAMVALGG
ncbi:MAG: radical SAM protein [Planctomycetes bacterium]|nr:radical SAM protein [Planctomycetota bacterium]